ncbi:hypothetical protein HR45_15110 [Shewanella mangrovi]|uniref:Lipoprotein n=1 Tax=Shewanella mangrovi TaxID=1515746 RepID=A0A094JVZ9_9GAMM|nr:hypothetical protein [Shewanella mangrovi]KFZ36626.1 hypothetical protein HR45_15110 [Shewanella mangrovi]
MFRRLLWLSSFLLLSACSPKNEVTFSPSRGDQQQYWSYADIAVTGYGQVQTSTMLQRYKVTETSPLTLEISNRYLDIGGAGGHHITSFSSAKGDEKLQRLFSKGFEITLDPDSGNLIDFRGLDAELWQQLRQDGGERLVNMLKKSMLSPGVLQTIPARQGASLQLLTFANQQAKLSVELVTDTQLIASVSASDQHTGAKLYGELVLDRDNGWLQQLLMVVEQPMPEVKPGAKLHMRLAMLPEDHPVDFNFDDFEPMTDWMPLPTQPEDDAELKTATGAELLPYDSGYYAPNPADVTLVLPESSHRAGALSDIRLRNIVAFDEQGNKLPLAFSWQNSEPAYYDQLSSQHHLLPLGWNLSDTDNSAASFSADADYYPTRYFADTRAWQPGAQHFDIQGVTVEIVPDPDDPLLFTIHSDHAANFALQKFFRGLQGELKLPPYPAKAPWLNTGDNAMFSFLSQLPRHDIFELRLTELPTQPVTFYVAQYAEQPSFSKPIKFISPDIYRLDATLPPTSEVWLYGADPQATLPAVGFNQIQAVSDTAQGSSISLPSDWASICELRVVDGSPQQGHALVWQKKPHQGYSRYTPTSDYQLGTDDAIRHYFYGIAVTSELSCQGQPQWQDLPYQADAQAWLIPLTAFGEVDSQQSIASFLSHYQLLNEQGQPLHLIGLDGYLPAAPEQTPLADILTKQRQLRVAGKVSSLRQLKIVGEPLSRQWTQAFPALP